ncbi:MAG: hypothetical protein H6935_06915 [Thiobacillus sp.]|nr:hypothetical protein [Thiobacillus sp.]
MRRIFLCLCLLAAGPVVAAPLMASKNVDMRQAMDDLTLAAMNHGMQLVKVQPIDSALVKRGFDNPHVRIAFIGSETAVRWAEAADSRLLNLLPLRLSLVQRGDQVVVMSDDLAPWKEEFKDSPGLQLLRAWEVELGEVLRDFAGQ